MRSREPGRTAHACTLLLGWCVLLSACVINEPYDPPPPPTPVPDLVEDRSVYAQDDLEVLTVNITVPNLDQFAAVEMGVVDARAAMLFQEGSYAAELTAPNGTIELRGNSSRNSSQRSYKVKLAGAAWRGMTNLNLIKHPYDLTRVRNRLSFEYMRSIPNFGSLRTQFVHLFINGVDRGLYENVENPGKTYLAAHGLPAGELYKANDFAFYSLTDVERWNPEAFETVLESKGIETDRTKVAKMLDDVNDPFIETDYVFAKYFNRDNYMTWLAVNLLFGNFDTINQNFLLYSPPDLEGWYFLPWDYDGAWSFNGPDGQPGTQDRPRSRMGVGTWWLSPLHQRFLREPENRTALVAKMDELLATVLSDERTRALLAQYHDLVREFISRSPDVDKLPIKGVTTQTERIAAWETEYARIGGHLSRAYDDYFAALDLPMTIFLADPQISGGDIYYRWDASFDFQGDPLTYTLEVSRTPAFAPGDLVLAKSGLTSTSYKGDELPAGQYYWRVLIRDDHDNWQDNAEVYYDPEGTKYLGVRALTVR